MSRIAIAAAVVMLSAASAAAEPATKVFPLAGPRMPKSKKDLPEVLTRAVARSLSATVASAPIEDAADLMMCKVTQASCLRDVAKSAGAQRIVYGSVTVRAEGGVTVRLSWFGGGDADERTFVLTGDTSDELAAQLARNLRKSEPDEQIEPPAPPPPPPPPPTMKRPLPPVPGDEEPVASSGRITGGTWALIIGGGVAAVTGAGFMFSAQSLLGDIQRAPTSTRADFDRLIAIERAGKLRMQIGTGLALAGTTVAVIGVVRAVLQKRDGAAVAESPTVSLTPSQHGASLVYARSW